MHPRQDAVFAFARSGISDGGLVTAVETFLAEVVPPEWWTAPASSSGQYHPSFALGDGGLVRHSAMVARWTEELARLYMLGGDEASQAFAAGLVHDGFKGGSPWGGSTDPMHGHLAADAWRESTGGAYPVVEDAIRRHFAAWDPVCPGQPAGMPTVASVVAVADFAASRKFPYDGTWSGLIAGL